MGTQGPGRKRIPNREKLVAEDDALNQIAREAEARLAAKRAARAEAREIRMKELERQQKELFHSHKEDSERYSRHSRRHASVSDDEEKMSVGSRGSLRPSDYSGFLGSSSRASSRASSARASPVVEDRMDRDFPDKGSRTASTLSAATLASLGGASSRRGSCDTSFSVETEASIRDIKDSLAEAEEKYRKAMVSNAQLHNEKLTLIYQVDTLREELIDMEELLLEARRQHDNRTKELERERQAHTVLQSQFKEMSDTLRKTEELLTEVSDLRVKSSSYCQEVSDLQEALQWKEKKIAALERHREISDIVRIERDRLREEVVQLRDLLKEHGVVILPEISTNGDMGQDKTDDDVTAESASQLAQELSRSGRESMLGHDEEQQPAEGSKPLHDDRCRIYYGSQSLNVISSEQTKPATVKGIVKQTQDRTEQQTMTNEETETDAARTLQIRQSRSVQFRKVGNKSEPLTNEPGTNAQIHEPKCAVSDDLYDLRIYEGKSDKDTVEIQEKTPKSSTVLSFVPTEMLKDWTGLENTIQSILRGFVEYQDLVTKISKMVPEIPYPLNWWIRELEDKLKNIAGSVLTQCDRVDAQSTGLKKTTAACELPLKDFREGGNAEKEPENVKQTAAESSQVIRKHLNVAAAKFLEAPSLAHPQPDSRIVCEDSQGIQGTTENACGTNSSLCGELPLKALPQRSKHPQTCGFFVNSSDSKSTVCDGIQEHSGVDGKSHQPTVCQMLQSFSVPVEKLKMNHGLWIKPQVDRSSELKWLLGVTTGDVEVTAIPEISLMSLQGKTIHEDRLIEDSSGENTKSPEEHLVKDVDDCKEAAKYTTAQQPATQPEHRPEVEVVGRDVKVCPAVSSVKHLKRFGLDDRKEKCKSQCKTS